MTIDQAIEIIVHSDEYLFYGTYWSQSCNQTLYKIRRRDFQGDWGLNTERELFTIVRLLTHD